MCCGASSAAPCSKASPSACEKPFLAQLCEAAVETLAAPYPALGAARDSIVTVAREEEVRFRRTLDQGMRILDEALVRARDAGAELPAQVAFELHDTYGFPFDLTREIAAGAGSSKSTRTASRS